MRKSTIWLDAPEVPAAETVGAHAKLGKSREVLSPGETP